MESSQNYIAKLRTAGLRAIESHNLSRPNDLKASLLILDVVLNWYALFSSIYFLPSWLSIPFGWILTVRLLNCMAQISHACGHYSCLESPKWNDSLGMITSAMMGYGFKGHNDIHDDHHRYLNTLRDGDVLWGRPDQSRKDFLIGLSLDLVGFQAFRRLGQYFSSRKPPGRPGPIKIAESSIAIDGLLILVSQGILYLLFYFFGGPWAYFLYYVIPICTLYPAQARIRSLAEHHIVPGHTVFNPPWVARDTSDRSLSTHIVGPFFQNYHLEHHLFPKVPGYNLKILHQLLDKEFQFDEQVVNKSYFSFMLQFLWERPPQAEMAIKS